MNKNRVVIKITRIIPVFLLPLMRFALSIRRTAGDRVTYGVRGGRIRVGNREIFIRRELARMGLG
jgi:hypothetical protein